MYAQIDPVPHAADLVAKSTDCPLTRMRSTSVWGAPNDSTRSLTLAISDWKGQPVPSVHQQLPATGDPRDVRRFALAAPMPVEGPRPSVISRYSVLWNQCRPRNRKRPQECLWACSRHCWRETLCSRLGSGPKEARAHLLSGASTQMQCKCTSHAFLGLAAQGQSIGGQDSSGLVRVPAAHNHQAA